MATLDMTIRNADATILFVEDESDIRDLVAAFLREAGYCVLAAAQGEEAWQLFDRHPEIAVLLTDVMLPGETSGFSLARLACRTRPELRVIYVTGYVPQEDWLTCDKAPGPILHKPFQLAQLHRQIEEALRG